ncbi:proline--tRNA ligase [Ketogulonicigenium vulgare]|uniref:Proline--tRNA ligase n=1 Tax=Ketogulonicigenium vulgare (strain WSH-001) TaxID=759362 RepID=F9Y9W3_KETVW|nr:proline--tRNA ligase [Ketogulonicigenium vulgare]ADO41995.1 prolyl-tRNA synthetase [Ketogulonicigenium vulgare Y25]AEM40215.1 Prolyl-tRNA synthetase protein [Ketogulonicigenium vulgare WSH-001]ALJ80417.1 proline--tRNA ligase [Ketogulonicigenium vulgare]ANW33246.1 proline--tRNA ligase [Ketogulonicigenium vulgare]AOZ53919.1 prolyl-tRNA synthetase [Ketogulonicigenium vulgare]
MRLSRYFLPVLKENPAEAQILSHRYMLRAGMIKQESAGIYAWLPLGYKVLSRLEKIVHEEQQRAGHIPLLMPTLQSADLWRESGRYDAYGPEMLRMTDRNKREMLFGPTNEEMITDIFRSYVRSYKDLPLTLYHIQWKFRDEMRPRFGVMRGREFLMKDGYNFDLTREDALHAYNRHMVSYLRTYERMGLTAIPMRADSGPIGGDDTHEFLVLANTGESEVFYDEDVTRLKLGERAINYDNREEVAAICQEFTTPYARTDETHDAALFDAIPEGRRKVGRGIEVGQIFYFGTKYSEPMGATVQNAEGKQVPVEMGSHGIGVSRLIGALIEANHDDKGIIWPEGVTPFHVGIVNLKQGDAEADAACEALHDSFVALGLDPLYDDRDERAGGKFATMDLIGLPWRITVGPRGLKNGVVELTSRRTGVSEELPPEEAIARIAAIYANI